MNAMKLDTGMNLGRDKLPWSSEIWARIDQAVYDECQRTKIAGKFIPLYGPVSPGTVTITSDRVVVDERTLAVNEAATTPLCELLVEFTLTPQQIESEEKLMTAVTLATRAANLLSQAEDVVIFQGQSAVDGVDGPQHPLFAENKVQFRSGPAGSGLLNAPATNIPSEDNSQIVTVPVLESSERGQRYGENTFGAVAEAYSRLQSGEGLVQAHYGPYALVLHFEPYADTYAPLPTTLIMPADRIKPLVTDRFHGRDMHTYENGIKFPDSSKYMSGRDAHFYGTGTLPKLRGLLVSLGGNTMDLVVGMDAKTSFLTQDSEGNYLFRVYERFALRLKDPTSAIRLEFEGGNV